MYLAAVEVREFDSTEHVVTARGSQSGWQDGSRHARCAKVSCPVQSAERKAMKNTVHPALPCVLYQGRGGSLCRPHRAPMQSQRRNMA